VAASDRLVFPPTPPWWGPELALLNAVVSVFALSFAAVGIGAIAGGIFSGNGAPVIFGILWTTGLGYITWTYLHLASRLEFSAGCLSWRCSLPWSPRMRPGQIRAIRWRSSYRSRYVRIELTDGRKLSVLPRRGLMDFIDGVRARAPTVVIDLDPSGRGSGWMRAEPAGSIGQRVTAISGHRGLRVVFSIVVSLVLLSAVAEIALTAIGPQENYQTLRSDLAKVHLPPGYGLIASQQAGDDCAHQECSLTQTWSWRAASPRSNSAACRDVYRAMTSAFSGVDANTPMPAGASCDYYAILGDLLHPGQGKRTVEAIVRPGQARTGGSLDVRLTASYG
jgi:hypothetical protein